MGVRFHGQCVDVAKFHEVVAAECPTISNDGMQLISCVPSANQITVFVTDIATNNTISQVYVPAQIACNEHTIADTVELAWYVALVWIAAWAVKSVADTIRGRN